MTNRRSGVRGVVRWPSPVVSSARTKSPGPNSLRVPSLVSTATRPKMMNTSCRRGATCACQSVTPAGCSTKMALETAIGDDTRIGGRPSTTSAVRISGSTSSNLEAPSALATILVYFNSVPPVGPSFGQVVPTLPVWSVELFFRLTWTKPVAVSLRRNGRRALGSVTLDTPAPRLSSPATAP